MEEEELFLIAYKDHYHEKKSFKKGNHRFHY